MGKFRVRVWVKSRPLFLLKPQSVPQKKMTRPGTDLIERLGQKSKPLGQRLLRVRRPVIARSPLGDQSVTGRRVQKRSAIFDLATLIFDLNRSTANARLGRCTGGERPGTERILAPRLSPAGCRAISLKLAGGRWETARVSVGHRSVTAGTPPGEALRFCLVLT